MIRRGFLVLLTGILAFGACDRDRQRPNDWETGNRPNRPWDPEPGDPWRPERWVELGSQRVEHRRQEVVRIYPGQFRGRFQQVRFTVNRGDLDMSDVVIVRDNGQRFEPNVRHQFKSGSWSRVIDLPSPVRGFREIRFMCRAMDRHTRPVITVFAR